jgi:type I restriction enzyme, R subunit
LAPYNEADTRAKLIDPRIKLAGWGEGQIEREHYFVKGKTLTDGRIYLVGDDSRRREPRRLDYLLRYNGQMVAVLEAKDESHAPDAGLEQAKSYARLVDVPFAYSSNGHAFVEFDFLENKSRELVGFPNPDDLWSRWQETRTVSPSRQVELKRESFGKGDPLLQPFCPPSRCGKEMRYFQEVAVKRVIERMVDKQKRILLTMATGTGKTFTAFQAVWKLRKSGWLRKPVLFIADRNVLRDQAFNTFAPFVDGQSDPRAVIEGGKFNANRDLYFALYQSGLDPLWWTPESLGTKPPRRESICPRVQGPATHRSSRPRPFSWPAPLQRGPSANSLTS